MACVDNMPSVHLIDHGAKYESSHKRRMDYNDETNDALAEEDDLSVSHTHNCFSIRQPRSDECLHKRPPASCSSVDSRHDRDPLPKAFSEAE